MSLFVLLGARLYFCVCVCVGVVLLRVRVCALVSLFVRC